MKKRIFSLLLAALMIIGMTPMEAFANSEGQYGPWYEEVGFHCICYPGYYKDYAGGIMYAFAPEFLTDYPTVDPGVPDPNRDQIKAMVEQHADVSRYAVASTIVDEDGNVDFYARFYCDTMTEANRAFFYVVYNAPTIAEATAYFVSKSHAHPVHNEIYNLRLDDENDEPVPTHIHNFTGQYYTSGASHQRQCIYEGCTAYGVMDGTLVKVDEFENCVFDQEVESSKYIKTQGNCTTPAVYYKSCECGSKSIVSSPTFSGSSPIHTLSNNWSKNATHHWHACKAEGCPIEDYANCDVEGVNYAEHTWTFGVCTECKYVCQHNYVEGVCTICGAESSDDDFAGGDGSQQDPYQIATKAQLENLAKKVIDGNSFEGKYFVLMNDIGTEEDPVTTVIGNDLWGESNKFEGTFDGDGYKVTMKIGEDFDLAAALMEANISLTDGQLLTLNEAFSFGEIYDSPDSVLERMNWDYEHQISDDDFSKIMDVVRSAPKTENYIGLFCYNAGVIKNVETAGSLIGGNNIAGICAVNVGTIINCHNSCYLKGGSSGGICSNNMSFPQEGTIINCYNEGKIEGDMSGGICGWNMGAIRNCYSCGEVTGNSVGGICGSFSNGSIKNCYYNSDKFSGNLIGDCQCWTLENNEALVTGQMTAASNNTYSGEGAVLNGKPLIDLLNDKVETGCKVWLNIDGIHPVFELAHDHSFAEAWTKNETAHWHACTADGCKIKNYATCNIADAAYGTHEWSNGVCSVCEYKCTHSFDNGGCAYCDIEQIVTPTAAEELIYNGNTQIGVEEGTGYTLTGTASAIDAGEYQATATLKNGYIWADNTINPKNISWEIAQLEITDIVLTDGSVEYDGSEQKPGVMLFGGNAKYSVPDDAAISYGNGDYVDVGTYTVSVNLSGCKNFTGAPSKEYSIVKCETNTITGVPAQNNVTLGDAIEADLSDVKVAFGTPVAVYYSDENCTTKVENINEITKTGTYYVRAEVAGTDNYVGAVSKAISFTVTPAHTHSFTYKASGAVLTATCADTDSQCDLTDKKVTLTLTKNTTENYYVYDGSAKTVDFATGEAAAWKAAVGSDAPNITYTAKEGSALTEGKAVKAGSYTATVTVDTNKTATLDFAIAKATPTVTTAPTASAITYGQTLNDSSLTDGVGSVEGTFAWTTSTTSPAVSDSEKTEYDVTFTPKDTTNYNTTTCKVKVKVNPADYTGVTDTASANLEAKNGKTVEITLPTIPDGANYGAVSNDNTSYFTVGTISGGKLTVTSAKDWVKETDGETAKTFTVAVTPDDNHNGYDITVSITPVYHTHSFTYTADGATLTATCTDGCTDGYDNTPITLTLTAGDSTYDGNAYSGASTNDETIGFSTATGATVTIEYYKGTNKLDTAPTDAGDYTAKIAVGEKTAMKAFEINKASPTVELFTFTAPESTSLTYDGNNKTASVTFDAKSGEFTGMGTVTVKYQKSGESTWSADAPKDAGTYVVAIEIAEGDNYTSASALTSGNWAFEIGKASVAVPEANSEAFTYSGEDQSYFTLTGNELYAVASGDGLSAATQKDAGTYTIKLSLKDADNYKWASGTGDPTYTFTIAKAVYDGEKTASGDLNAKSGSTLTVDLPTLPTGAGYAATGTGFSYGTATVANGKLTLTVGASDVPDNTAAFDVTVAVTGAKNYEDYNVTVTVTPVYHTHGSWSYAADGATITATCGEQGCDSPAYSETLTISAPTGTPTYDGATTFPATLTSTVEGKIVGADLPTISYEKKNASGSYEAYSGEPKDAGDYKASVSVGEETASVEFTVAKRDLTVNDLAVTVPEKAVYDGQEHAATAALETATPQLTGVGKLTVKYQKQNGDGWDDAATDAPKAAGTYKVLVSAEAGDNFNATKKDLDVSKQFTIAPRPVTLVAASKSRTYDGDPLTNNEFTVKEGTSFVSGEGVSVMMTAESTITDVGSVSNVIDTVTAKEGTDLSNYTITKENGTLTVTAAALTVTATAYEAVYDGEPHNISYTVTDANEAEVTSNAVYFREAGEEEWTSAADFSLYTDVCTKTVEVRVSKENYADATDSAAVTIKPKTVELIWSTIGEGDNAYKSTYDGTDQTSKITASYKDIGEEPHNLVVAVKQNSTATAFKNAGSYPAEVTGFAEADTGSKNYALPTAKTQTYTMNTKVLTANVKAEKVYDGTAAASATQVTAAVVTGITGETLTISGVTGTFNSANVAESQTVTPDGANMTVTAGEVGTLAANYTVSLPESGTGKITAFDLANAMVTIDPTAYDYTGSEIKPTPAVTFDAKGENAIPTADYTVSYENNINAAASTLQTGAPTVTVTAKTGNVINSKSVTFTINKIDKPDGAPTTYEVNAVSNSSLSLETIGIDLSGAKITKVEAVSGKTGMVIGGAPSIINNGAAIQWTTVAQPSGTVDDQYTLTVSSDNWKDFTVTVSFKGKIPVTVNATGEDFVYGDADKTGYTGLSVEKDLVDAASLEFLYESTGTTAAYSSAKVPTDVGTYKVTISVPASNTTYMGSKTVEFAITQQEVAVPSENETVFTYDGEEKTYMTVAADALYKLADDSAATSRTDAGETTIKLTLKDAHNYKWANNAADPSYTFTIAKKQVEVIWGDTALTYDPAAIKTPSATYQLLARDGGGTPDLTVTTDAADTNVGTFTASAAFNAHDIYQSNYELIESTATQQYAVSPKAVNAPSITLTPVGEKKYTGNPVTLSSTEIELQDGNAVIPASEYTVSYQNNTNAGTAILIITDKEGGNYTVSGQTTFTIAKAAQKAPTAPSVSGNTVTIAEADREKKLEYSLDSENAWISVPTLNNGAFTLSGLTVGSHTIYLREKESSNYFASPSVSKAFELTQYSVAYNANGGVGSIASQTANSGSSVTVKSGSAMSRTGYTFTGWNTKADGSGTSYAAGASINSGATLYAQWNANTYTVRFNANGGSGTMTDQSFTYDAAKALTANAFTRTSYTFIGWATSANGPVLYSDAQSVKNLAGSGTVTLYAVWAQNVYSITVNITSPQSGDVQVKLQQGNAVYAVQNNISMNANGNKYTGSYSFTGVPAGTYNIEVTQTIGGDKNVTMTQLVVLNANSTANIDLPTSGINSKLEVEEDTLPTVVGGLEKEAEANRQTGKDITVKMTVEKKEEQQLAATASEQDKATQDAISEIKATANGKALDFMNIEIEKTTVEDGKANVTEAITETSSVLELVFSYEMNGKKNIQIYRQHGDAVQTFTKLDEKPAEPYTDGTFYVDTANSLIYVYAKQFSTYAIGYEEQSGGGSTGGGGGSSSYAIESESAKNGTFSVDKKSASAGSTVTITVAPDKGFALETLTVLDKNGNEVEVKNLGNNKYSFKMPSSEVTVSATFMEDNTMLNFFVDVKATDYYYDAVLWAAENDITKGTDAVHFSPDMGTTRAQVVTFLWRTAGCPEPEGDASKFVDVPANEYYAKAVAWAIEQVITKGTSETTFSPDVVCTRAHIVTFLARFAGVADEDAGYTHGFTDVKATDYFNNAVAWAYENKVTAGTTATTFGPNTDCTRAQVVTFLYRWMVK